MVRDSSSAAGIGSSASVGSINRGCVGGPMMTVPIDASADETNEALEQIRQVLMSPGWQRHMAPAMANLMDHVKNQLVELPSAREKPYNEWSEERISGFVTGIDRK